MAFGETLDFGLSLAGGEEPAERAPVRNGATSLPGHPRGARLLCLRPGSGLSWGTPGRRPLRWCAALIDMGLLEQAPDPGSARRILIRTTAGGQRVRERAQATIAVVESALADRFGATAVVTLRQTLSADRGQPPLVAAP